MFLTITRNGRLADATGRIVGLNDVKTIFPSELSHQRLKIEGDQKVFSTPVGRST